MSYSLTSLNGGELGDHIGEHYSIGDIKADTKSLDSSSHTSGVLVFQVVYGKVLA